MIGRWPVVPVLAAFLVGCAVGPPPAAPERTVQSLDAQPTVVLRETAVSDLQLALEAYRRFIREAPEGQERRHAMRREADLQLAIGEEALARGDGTHGTALHAAVEAYWRLLRTYPDLPRPDEIRYQIARAHDNNGDEDQSLAALGELVDRYPESPLYVEAQFRRGEVLFSRGDHEAAQVAYTAVLETHGAGVFHDQARYKRGWSRYLQGRIREALGDFRVVLERGLVSGTEFRTVLVPESLPPARRELVGDTLRVIALGLDRLGGTRATDRWFSEHEAAPFEPLVYSALSALYQERGDLEASAGALEAFVARHPVHEQAPLFQIRIAELHDRAGQTDAAERARMAFIRDYGRDSGYWEVRDLNRMPRVARHLKEEVLSQAQRSHAAAQASGAPDDFRDAARWYRDYLAFFPDDRRAPELALRLGDALFESGQYAEAITAYEQSAYRYSPHERAAEAGHAALVAYQHLIDEVEGDDEAHQALLIRAIDAAVRFVSQFPRHSEVRAVMARTARQFFASGQHSRALAMATRIIESSEDEVPAELRHAALVTAGDVHVAQADHATAETAYAQALAIGEDEAVRESLARSIYRQGEAARATGRPGKAREYFRRAAAAARDGPTSETAAYDAAAMTLALRDWATAIDELLAFRRRWPESTHRLAISRELALAHAEAGQPGRAAEEFQRVAVETEDADEARAALWRAAELHEDAGDTTRSALAWQRYISLHPEPLDQATEARLRLARVFGTAGDDEGRRRWLGEVVVSLEGSKAGQGSDFSREAAARAALELARPLHQAYEQVRLVLPLDASLRAKRQAMEEARDAYRRVARFGVPKASTEATHHIGTIYQQFAEALLGSERPPDLTTDEREEYDVLLEEQAFPFEEEAIRIHEVNLSRIPDGHYDEWIRASRERLAELLPARYARTEKGLDIVDALD